MGNVARTPRLVDLKPSGSAGWPRGLNDPVTTFAWDATAQTLGISLHQPARLSVVYATISAVWSVRDGRWAEVRVKVDPSITGIAVERFNRLLVGLTSAPRLETYWRTKAIMLRTSSGRYALPAETLGRDLLLNGVFDWSTSGPRGSRTVRSSVPARRPIPASPVSTSPTAPMHPVVPMPAPTLAPAAISDPSVRPLTEAEAREALGHVVPPAPKPTPKVAPVAHLFKPVIKGRDIPHKVHAGADLTEVLDAAYKRFLKGQKMVVQLDGPTGSGKTLHAQAFAERHGLPFLKLDVMGMNTFADWAGSVTLTDGEKGIVTQYTPSTFIEAISTESPDFGIPRVLLLDEVNRAAGTSAMNILLPALDHTGTIHIPDAKKNIQVDPAVFFIVTANIGAQYGGTIALDGAFRSRIKYTEPVDYLPAAAEAAAIVEQSGCPQNVAEAFVKIAVQTRALAASRTIDSPPVSTRQMVSAGQDVVDAGRSPLRAALSAWVHGYSNDGGATSERATVLAATEGVLRGLNV